MSVTMPVLFGRTFWSCQHISPPVWRITAGIFWIAIAQFRLNTLHGMLWLIASIVTIGFRPLPAFAAIAKLPQEDTTTSAFQVPSREEATSSASDTCSSGSDVRSLSHQGKWGVFNRGDGSAAGFGPVKNYGTEPWAEEWRELPSGPCSPHDPLDALKHIDLNDSRSIWLSLSGETRLRNWFDSKPDLGAYHNNDSGRFTVRNLYGADLHLGTHVRVFGQLVNGEAAGWNAFGYGPTYRKAIDLQQAFIEITGKAFGARQGFIFGRQEFLDAPPYMLSNRQTPNIPISWNGFRAYSVWKRVRVDAFDFVQTDDTHSGAQDFKDTENYNNRLYGVNITVAPPDLHVFGGIGWSFLDLFYIGYKLAGHPAAASTVEGALAGSTTRNNLGFRWHGSAGPLVFSMGGIYQGGIFHEADSSMRRPVAAFSINTSLAYRFRSVPWVPLLGIQTDIYSGGGANSRTGLLGNYIEPFGPNTNYIDTTTYLTGSNLVGVTPFLSLNPLSFLNISLKYPFYWRESTDDAVYSYFLAGRYTFTRPMSGGFIGMAPQASMDLKIGRHLTWTQYVARFITSHSLDRVGGSSSTYYQSNLVFRF
ncbi:alginate export family protein [Gluconobacter morbifer]|uniref:alginate export family protein n=1 Tax=Gluconobacter morbifer TaxID=479935 RepID=UPI001FDF8E39|nr:alginate export family protein [Gluconobacter morbifer]